MADTDQPRRSSTSWSRETQTNGKISSPAGDLRTKYQHTHSKEAPIDVACALPAKQYGAVAHRVRAHHAPQGQAARCAAVQHGHEAGEGGGGEQRKRRSRLLRLRCPSYESRLEMISSPRRSRRSRRSGRRRSRPGACRSYRSRSHRPPLLGASIGPPRAAADDEATVATATTEAGGPAESATSGGGEGVRW